MTEAEIPLPGGMGSGGAVVPRRQHRAPAPAAGEPGRSCVPAPPRKGWLREARLDFLGTDDKGHAVLSYIDGEVGIPPYPEWTTSEELLISVAALQRRLHDSASSFVVSDTAVWQRANLPEPGPGAIVCHNDLCIENVVTRHGQAVAFIDFDFAAPADPIVDIAIAARHWIPVRDPDDIPRRPNGSRSDPTVPRVLRCARPRHVDAGAHG